MAKPTLSAVVDQDLAKIVDRLAKESPMSKSYIAGELMRKGLEATFQGDKIKTLEQLVMALVNSGNARSCTEAHQMIIADLNKDRLN